MKTKTFDLALEIKSVDDSGTFAGYGSVFGEIDAYREVVAKGATKKSLKTKHPALLWQHQASQPVGIWESLKEDDHGLAVKGRLVTQSAAGSDAYELLKAGAVKGLSIGYMPVKYAVDEKTKILTHTEIDLWEISLVTFPACASAQVDSVKTIFEGGNMPTERELEEFLRDAGLSRAATKTLISCGYRACLRDADSSDVKAVGEVADQLAKLIKEIQNG